VDKTPLIESVVRDIPEGVKFLIGYNNSLKLDKSNKFTPVDINYYSKVEKGNALYLASKIPSLCMITLLSPEDPNEIPHGFMNENLVLPSSVIKPGFLSSKKYMGRMEKRLM